MSIRLEHVYHIKKLTPDPSGFKPQLFFMVTLHVEWQVSREPRLKLMECPPSPGAAVSNWGFSLPCNSEE